MWGDLLFGLMEQVLWFLPMVSGSNCDLLKHPQLVYYWLVAATIHMPPYQIHGRKPHWWLYVELHMYMYYIYTSIPDRETIAT